MARLDGRVAIVTGAGRGLGRAHALRLASEGAQVVVNDLGGDLHGAGADPTPAQDVVAEITAAGGEAVVSGHDVADWDQAEDLIATAVSAFGRLDVLVNNAGILRDRTLAKMTEQDWDDVIRVHLKGHAAPTRHAMAYWKARAGEGDVADRSVVMTSSIAGLAGNFGQANYSSAKLAVLALAEVCRLEGARFGVRANAVSPGGRTRIALSVPGATEQDLTLIGADGTDLMDPASVSVLIAWLAAADCPANGQVLHITGDHLVVSSLPPIVAQRRLGRRWTTEDLDEWLPPRLVTPLEVGSWVIDAAGAEQEVSA